jgi:hypothetical protein
MRFYIRVTRNSNADVTALYSPDFGVDLIEYVNEPLNQGYIDKASAIFLEHLLVRVNRNFRPKEYADLSYIILKPEQTWESLEVDFTPGYLEAHRGFFSRALPMLGNITNSIKVVTNAYITFMSLKVASGPDNDSDSAKALSISGAALNSFVVITIYYYSDTSLMLSKIGAQIDRLVGASRSSDANDLPNNSNEVTQHPINISHSIFTLLIAALVTADVAIMATGGYQQAKLLCDKFIELESGLSTEEKERKRLIIMWAIVYMHLLAAGFTLVVFHGSFMPKFISDCEAGGKKLKDKVCQSKAIDYLRCNRGIFFRPYIGAAANIESDVADAHEHAVHESLIHAPRGP